MVTLKSQEELEMIKIAGAILKRVLKKLETFVASGKTSWQIDELTAKLISQEQNAVAAFKGYKGFPANICVSLNEEVVHGIPSVDRKIKSGDIVSLDLGIGYKGYFADAAVTLPVGVIDLRLKKLIRVTKEALWKGIKQARINNCIGDISWAIQSYVEANGFSVVRQFVGHGIGRSLQEEPEIPNFGQPHQGLPLRKGMVLAIEPMVNMGSWEVEILDNNWTVVTKDRLASAHFEHTVAITENGPVVLT